MDVPSDILSKMQRYCAYQERCEADVRKKLNAAPLSVAQRDEIIRLLVDADFLNESRFVETFIRSKIKEQWGRLKIRQALLLKGASSQLVSEKMQDIDEDGYMTMLSETIEKWKRTHQKDAEDKSKMIRFLLTKGFSIDEVMRQIHN